MRPRSILAGGSGGNPVNFTTGFHTYAVEWDKNASINANEIRYYVDGNQFMTVDAKRGDVGRQLHHCEKHYLQLGGGGQATQTVRPPFRRQCPSTTSVFGIAPSGTPGDYNGDHQIDAADYLVWRKSLGQTGIGLPADGSGNGSVGQEDYEVWRRNFGMPLQLAQATSIASTVPEPSAAVQVAISFMLIFAQRLGVSLSPDSEYRNRTYIK